DATARTAVENRHANYHVTKYQPAKTLQRQMAYSKENNEQCLEAIILTGPFKIKMSLFLTFLLGKPGNLYIYTDNGTTINIVYQSIVKLNILDMKGLIYGDAAPNNIM
ncbi:unnamed protein product, partial [Onchocerca ochengi]